MKLFRLVTKNWLTKEPFEVEITANSKQDALNYLKMNHIKVVKLEYIGEVDDNRNTTLN